MQIFDSQFSQYVKEYFPEDKPITSEKAIATELDKIELPSTKLFSQTFDRAIDAAVTQLQSAIANKDPEAVQKYKWNLNIGLANNIFGEWLLGWQTGSERGRSEVAKAGNKTSEFNQPEPQSDILRNRPAEAAIKARVNTLAKDVSDSEWQQIKGIILDAIKPISQTENPISRKELLKRINEQLGDRKARFKNRAERIARTELTFAYNAGRLDSYVRSGLVAGVRYQTIFDERRCPICTSRQGIVVSLDDIEGLARLQIPTHPMCRCVWSPVLKEEFEIQSKQKNRKIKNRSLVPSKPWLAGAILAAILIPEELFGLGILAAGIKLLVNKAGSAKLARAAIANKINSYGSSSMSTPTPPTASKVVSLPNRVSPIIIANGLELRELDLTQLRSLIPSLSEQQALKILAKEKGNFKVKSFQDLASILDANQFRQIKAIARQNNLLNLLHPSNNLTPSAIWVNSGGIIPKNKTKAVFELVKNNSFSSVEELLEALRKEGIDIKRLNTYAIESFDRTTS